MKNGDMPSHPIIDGDTGTVSSADEAWDHSDPLQCIGLTKRERFAMAAMQGMLSNNDLCEEIGQGYAAEYLPEAISDMAYVFADAMLSDDDDTNND